MSNDERTPLIGDIPPTRGSDNDETTVGQSSNGCTAEWTLSTISKRLYVSHFLSTCNSRVFEFGSVLYLAAVFPGTLLPLSIYAVSRSASAILLSSLVGHYIDTGNRLQVVRWSIVLQRVAVAVSCTLFFILVRGWATSEAWKTGSLLILVVLSCVEKLASIMNLVSIERDWVVTIAGDDHDGLQVMNSQMRRIDLICKLFGPFLIGIMDGISTEVAILVNFGMNVASIPLEYLFIAQIYQKVPELRRREYQEPTSEAPGSDDAVPRRIVQVTRRIGEGLDKMRKDVKMYFNHRILLPSFSGALLYLTVLSFSGQMVTFLLSRGVTSAEVTMARTVSVGVEVLATWAGPWLMQRIGPVRAGLWFGSWQLGCLLVGVSIFWRYIDEARISVSGLVIGVIFSRLGLWGFDLCSQFIIQEEVEMANRGAFSTMETSWQNAFELCSYLSTIILSDPNQFGYPATGSVLAVACSWLLYSRFVWQRRGHLLHWPACLPQKTRIAGEDSTTALLRRRSWYST
ncbi:hypothetical protein V2G26_006640 [Clonostachys chloroleuca]